MMRLGGFAQALARLPIDCQSWAREGAFEGASENLMNENSDVKNVTQRDLPANFWN
jgi:hypothetical protein